MKMTTRKEITWSSQVLRFKAAAVPAIRPMGTEMNRERKFTRIVGGRRETRISHTGRPGRSLMEIPKFSSVITSRMK